MAHPCRLTPTERCYKRAAGAHSSRPGRQRRPCHNRRRAVPTGSGGLADAPNRVHPGTRAWSRRSPVGSDRRGARMPRDGLRRTQPGTLSTLRPHPGADPARTSHVPLEHLVVGGLHRRDHPSMVDPGESGPPPHRMGHQRCRAGRHHLRAVATEAATEPACSQLSLIPRGQRLVDDLGTLSEAEGRRRNIVSVPAIWGDSGDVSQRYWGHVFWGAIRRIIFSRRAQRAAVVGRTSRPLPAGEPAAST
jgi:hypothetical protein